MHVLNQYFDKIIVISASEAEDRRRYVRQTLSELGIDFEFFDAIMGNKLSDKELDRVYDEKLAIQHKTNKRPLSKAEIGCALSHIGIFRQLVEKGWKNVFIFEDDVAPVRENLGDARQALQELPADWDVFYMGTLDHYSKAPFSFRLKLLFYYPFIAWLKPDRIDYKYWQLWNRYPRFYSKTLKKNGFHLGNHAYAVSLSGAQKFLAYHDKIVTPIDDMIAVMTLEGELQTYITKEIMFTQNRDFVSNIEESRKEFMLRKRNNEYL